MKHIIDGKLTIEDAAQAFAALGSEQRLGVLQCLVRAGPDGLSIGEIGARSGVTGSTLTHHLRFLTQAGLLEQAKQGRSQGNRISKVVQEGSQEIVVPACAFEFHAV